MREKLTGAGRRFLRGWPGFGCPTVGDETPLRVVLGLAGFFVFCAVAALTWNPRFVTLGAWSVLGLPAVLSLATFRRRARTKWESCGCTNCIETHVRRWWSHEVDAPALVASLAQRHRVRPRRAEGRYLVEVRLGEDHGHGPGKRNDDWRESLATLLAVDVGHPLLKCSAAEADAVEVCCPDGTVTVVGPVDENTAEMAQRLVADMPLDQAVEVARATMA